MQDPKETYVAKSTQNKADNLPTNPSSGETARVGWRVASPDKRPSNPEKQTVVVIKGFLGQGYKHPGHPAALSLDPYLRRLPAGDGKGGTGQGKGRQGPGGLQAGRPGFPKLSQQRKMQERKRWQKSPTRPPGTNEKTRGTKRSKGNPTNPEEAKRHKTRRTEKKSTKCLGKRLQVRGERSEVDAQSDRGQLEKPSRQKKNSSPVVSRVS